MTRILDGYKVVEHGAFITGPYAAMLLADLGADVIKVERPGIGDPFRSFEKGLYGPQFQAFNRNKRSIQIDLEHESEREVLRALLKDADVYIQNHRPGVIEKLGFAPDAVRVLNPRLVYCSITGFGADGPYAHRPAYDTVAQGMSGFLSMFVSKSEPRVVGPATVDSVTGLYAAYGILGALLERHATGKGRLVEVSMLEAAMHFSIEQYHGYFVSGRVPGPEDRGRVSQSLAFTCRDGKLICLHLSSPTKFWDGLLAAIERPDLAQDPRFLGRMDRVHNHEALVQTLRSVFVTRPRAEWLARLEAQDVPHAPIYDLDEALDDPHVKHLGMERTLNHPTEGPVRTLRRPVVYDGDRAEIAMTPPPSLDEHGKDIRAALKRKKAGI
jgi:crotonobetainyl-CoA:carnitine CoA-transferase CaiB-like acyl-CoA transferase